VSTGFTNPFYDLNNWTSPTQSAADLAWVNPAYNPTQNDNGYTRFDPDVYGGGLERTQTYEQGARNFAGYASIPKGQPGYDHAQSAKANLLRNTGISDWKKATQKQLFDSFDLVMRGRQEDNQKENFKVGGFLKSLVGPALGVGLNFAFPGLGAVAAGAIGGGVGGAVTGGGFKGALTGAALGGAGGYIGGKFSGANLWPGSSGAAASAATGSAGGGIDWAGGLAGSPNTYNYGLNAFKSGGSALGFGAGVANAGANFARANAVPGGSSGITTPFGGGGLTTAQGAGTAPLRTNPLTLAGSGGASIGWNPTAVLGGATPASAGVANTATQLAQYADGRTPIPGTNQILGPPPSQAPAPIVGAPNNFSQLQDFLRLSGLFSTGAVGATGATGAAGAAFSPLALGGGGGGVPGGFGGGGGQTGSFFPQIMSGGGGDSFGRQSIYRNQLPQMMQG